MTSSNSFAERIKVGLRRNPDVRATALALSGGLAVRYSAGSGCSSPAAPCTDSWPPQSGHPHLISTEIDDLSPVPDGSIALAVMNYVLDHLLDPIAILRQIEAKLRPGGVEMIVTHNERSLLRRLMAVKFPPFCLQRPAFYSPASMTALLKHAGFAQVDVGRSANFFPIAFMQRQAAWTARIDLSRIPLPKLPVGLGLGNMITFAIRAR